ncbi:23S rRNA (uridine(2552)-2'-O)-methyltransferase RlmE [Stagnimonas aquatica]|uniref:Ribosomal RNA large subunit methyltransferase E n=1 Tax=Stagnimonas aquatica TaxID=2689987 RepID=A0A3N0VDY3_9GAMM|nr:23S rRNA (uridine(2552)-2'-O)-methyltransferase RlmE [Stagnimonas aquatica]ROH90892.1 23S rRNA (uridine(2552)-2'-O)-methyltransferase RlmE [Stagnimonas aquatica]
MSQKRRPSSARWLAEHNADHYVQEARRLGYRSRAVFKLQELNERDRLIKPGMALVDLGAAPGGWSQMARPMVGAKGRVIATDILDIEPIPGVDFLCGDFREESVLKGVEALVGEQALDLVLSDMAPNISGIDASDQAASLYLCELALEFARLHLKPQGTFVVKVFQGEGFDAYLKQVRALFGSVAIRKPKASRPRSSEVYLVAKNFRRV